MAVRVRECTGPGKLFLDVSEKNEKKELLVLIVPISSMKD